jgi:hypothetical protein
MKFSLIAICLCGLLCSFANAARPVSYLCVTEMSTGFLGEEKTGKWRVVRFNERAVRDLILGWRDPSHLARPTSPPNSS